MLLNFTHYYLKTRNQFYNEHLFPKVPERYLEFGNGKETSLNSLKPVFFKTIPFGESEKNVVKLLDKPRFVIENPFPQFPVKTLFYKEKLHHLRIISQIHFLNDSFFYACYSILNWKKADLVNYKEIILDKYLDKENTDEKSLKLGIQEKITHLTDKENNHLIIMPEQYLHFVYYCGNNELPQCFKRVRKIEEEKKLNKLKIEHDFF